MTRTSIAEVRAILPPSTQLTDAQITAAIGAATVMVDRIAAGCADDLTATELLQVETYLAAHFAAGTENALTVSSESSGCGGTANYGFKFGTGVLGTPFGQMANMLSNGCLAEYDKQPTGMFSIGLH